MKKETIKAMLGLTQQEIAMLLNVTRSQYSHYERNTRDLPSAASLRLNEMIAYMFSPEALQNLSKLKTDDDQLKQHLGKQLKENEFQLAVLDRKVNSAQEKFDKYQKAVCLMGFLNSSEQVKKAATPQIISSIDSNANRNFNKSKFELNLLKVDQKSLQLQQKNLQKELRKFEIS